MNARKENTVKEDVLKEDCEDCKAKEAKEAKDAHKAGSLEDVAEGSKAKG